LLPQRLADALRDPAVSLAVDDHRIDAAADIVDRRIARQVDPAGFRVDFHLAHRAAVGKHRIVHLIVRRSRERAEPVQRGLLGQFEDIEGAVARRRAEAPVGERN